VEKLDEQRLQRLIEAGRTLVSALDFDVVLERLLEIAAELTGAEYVALGILDPTKTSLERFITRGIDAETHRRIGDLPRGRGVLGLLITDPKPIRLSNVGSHPESYGFPPAHPAMTTFLGVPVRIRGEVFGNLYLTEKAGGHEFTDEDEASIVILADWAAIAIDNARLYQSAEERRQDLEKAVRGLEVTTAIARAVGGETDLDRVLELIVKRARALVHARGLTIMLAEGDDLVVAATAGEVDESLRGMRVPAAGTVAAEVLRSGRPERVSREVERSKLASAVLGIEMDSALVVPLAFRSQTMGVLTAIDRLDAGPQFNREDEELMLSFAASAATAVHTARSVGEERLRLAIEGAELERQRWARELHDETLQGLGSLQLLLSSALRQPDTERREAAVRGTLEHIGREINNLRNLITELRPAELDELGLESALESLAHRREETSGMRVVLDIDLGSGYGGAPRRLDSSIENTIYRLVQEALSNSAKHAAATRVDVRLTALPGSVELVVRDDGRGFDPGQSTSGFGLVGMRERVALVRGSFELESEPEAGTTLHVVLPVSEEAPDAISVAT
jgi:signal transduction histidine kinase